MSIALRARQPPTKPNHGQFLYLYSHLKTNQVIYSLKREINVYTPPISQSRNSKSLTP